MLRERAPDVIASQQVLNDLALGGQQVRIQTINLHHLYLFKHDTAFRAAIESADYLTADGWPVVWGLRRVGYKVERVTGADLVQHISSTVAVIPGQRIGLLGTTSRAGTMLAQTLDACGRDLVFADHGAVKDWVPADVAVELTDRGAGLALVAVTPPAGDVFAAALSATNYHGTVVGIGGAVDMAVGLKRRAPAWLQRGHAEWLYRLFQEPRRLADRYLKQCLPVLVIDLLPLALIGRKDGHKR